MNHLGRLEVICGPMFAGKTTELIRRLRAHVAAGRAMVAIKPARDTRYGGGALATHGSETLAAVELECAAGLVDAAGGAAVVGIDEAHFFGAGLVAPCLGLVASGVTVIVAGVERNHRGEPFEPFPRLLCEADEVVKVSSACAVCGRPAVHSQRMFEGDAEIIVGGVGQYQARCRACFRRD